MSRKIITISGVKYEIDTEDPNYRKRISPEEYSLKEDSKKVWDKTKELAKFIKSPEFVKYLIPGVNTKAFAEDAARNVNDAYSKLKEGKYRQAAGDGFYAISNILNGAASLAPFSDIFLPKGPVGYTTEIVSSPGTVDLTKPGKPATKLFSGQDLFLHGKKRLQRTVTDAEYLEALLKQFPKTYKLLQQALLSELDKAIVDWSKLPDHGYIMSTDRPIFSIPGGFLYSASEFKSILESQFPGLSTEQALDQLGVPDAFKKQFLTGRPVIKVDDSVIDALSNLTNLNLEQVRKLFFHEGAHATGVTAPKGTNYITSHNKKYNVSGSSSNVPNYYLEPDEIRARAMSIRRLHQATGESYEDILNNWNTGKYRPDPNIDDLVLYYDRESLLNYLNNFLKEGGKVNYLDIFKSGGKPKIHIKESQKGSFTKYCNGKVTNECIQRGKNSPDPKIRKKATFALNARHFKHQEGGTIRSNYDSTSLDETNRSLNIPEQEVEIPDYVTLYKTSQYPIASKKKEEYKGIKWSDIFVDYPRTEQYGFSGSGLSQDIQDLLLMFNLKGIKVKITSGYRQGAQTKLGRTSFHSTGEAVDIVPEDGDFNKLATVIKSDPEISNYMRSKGLGIIDETSAEMLARTGGTGAHFHLGKDKLAQNFWI